MINKVMGHEFTNEDREKALYSLREKSLQKVFIKGSTSSNKYVKSLLLEFYDFEEICNLCNQGTTWNEIPLSLQLDHINGDNTDNRIENLRFLCPNCHSQTETFCGKSMNKGKKKVSDERLIEAIKQSTNCRQALIKVGLTPKGGNYTRVHRLMIDHGLSFD